MLRVQTILAMRLFKLQLDDKEIDEWTLVSYTLDKITVDSAGFENIANKIESLTVQVLKIQLTKQKV